MKKGSLAFDKRKHPRVQLEIPVKYKLVNRSEQVIYLLEHKKDELTGASRDLSAQGLFLISDQRLSQGDILKLEVALPDGEAPVKAFSEVVWSSDSGLASGEHGSGLNFMALRDEDQLRMTRFIARTLADEA